MQHGHTEPNHTLERILISIRRVMVSEFREQKIPETEISTLHRRQEYVS